jgi:PAS domain S-box-containing protein
MKETLAQAAPTTVASLSSSFSRPGGERYDILFELSEDLMYACRAERSHARPPQVLYEWVSAGFTRITGYTLSEFAELGGMTAIVHPGDCAEVQNQLDRVLQGIVDSREFRIITKGGDVRWLRHQQQSVLDPQNEWSYLVYGIAQDITEFRLYEETLHMTQSELEERVRQRTAELEDAVLALQNEIDERQKAEQAARTLNIELQQALRLKDEFLANISHEFRTPLTIVLALSESLNMGIYGAMSAKQQDVIQRLYRQGAHLLSLVNNLLDIAKLVTGNLTLQKSLVQVNEACQYALQLVQDLAEQKSITLSFHFDAQVQQLAVDELRLNQILNNLLSNAVKFTPEHGHIGLDIKGDVERGVVSFEVWDTGIGIANEDQERLFLPFVQLDVSLSRRHEGAGLGLALVRELVHLHGGQVLLQSQPGAGSRFVVTLPWQTSL